MNEYAFDIRIDGDQLSPATMSFLDLAPFLYAFSEAVQAEGKKLGIPVTAKEHEINLVSIEGGSLILKYNETSEQMNNILASIISAFASNTAAIPTQKTKDFIKSAADLSKKNNYTISCHSPFISQQPIKLTDKYYQMPTFKVRTFSEPSWIYGKLIGIGGKENPTARIVSLDGKVVTCKIADKDLAKEMAHHLYGDMLKIVGEACYKHDDQWVLDDFIISSFSVMESTGIAQAVQEIKPFLADKYNSIEDIDAHIRSMRD